MSLMNQSTLWQSVKATYAIPSMEPLCLILQDRYDISVTVLLWALWLDQTQVEFDKGFWLQANQKVAWRNFVIKRLRALRRKLPKTKYDANLRNNIKNLEVTTEKKLLEKLERLTKLHQSLKQPENIQPQSYLSHYLSEYGAADYIDKVRQLAAIQE